MPIVSDPILKERSDAPVTQVSGLEAYELWASTYDSEPNPLLMLEQRELNSMLPEVKGKHVLDVGCGTGRWLETIADRGAGSTLGIDLSFAMLTRAKGKSRVRGLIVCGDCLKLPVRDSTADVVLCSFLVSYLCDLAGFAKEIARVCRRGAEIFISDFHPQAHNRGWKRGFRRENRSYEIATEHYSLDDLRSAFTKENCEICEVREIAFGEVDRPLFALNGKLDRFEEACCGPAVFILRLRRAVAGQRQRRSGYAHYSENLDKSAQAFRLVGARLTLDATTALPGTIEIRRNRISRIGLGESAFKPARQISTDVMDIDLTGYLILPGLINSHDHLEFSLYPRLGNGRYLSYEHWAHDIHHPDLPPVCEHRSVSKSTRLMWGAIKNLLCGVVTVCHHNPFEFQLFNEDFPVEVVRDYGWDHSLIFGKNVAEAFQSTPPDSPFVIHVGEGVDENSEQEIFLLDRMGALSTRTVIVHGVALTQPGLELLRRRGASLIWCPSSNLFLFGRTLEWETLKTVPRCALGSDSSLTGTGDLLDEIRLAYHKLGVPPHDLFSLVTTRATDVLRLARRKATLTIGAPADLIAITDTGRSPAETLVEASYRNVELVISRGRPRLFSDRMMRRWPPVPRVESLFIDGVQRFIAAPVSRIMAESGRSLDHISLAGRQVKQ